MGRIARNLIGTATVLIWLLVAAWFLLSNHPVIAGVIGALGLYRAFVLVRDWKKHSQAVRRRTP